MTPVSTRRRHPVLGLLLVAAALLLPTLATAQPPGTKVMVLSAPRTDAGEWSGTWFYQTRSDRWAIWIQVVDDLPQLRLQHFNRDRAEGFVTDWTSVSEYSHRGKRGEFSLTFDRKDENLIEGDWFWQFGTDGVDATVRSESASFRIFRASDGRRLVLSFEGFERVYRTDRTRRINAEQAWTFAKVSRRQVRWQELPF